MEGGIRGALNYDLTFAFGQYPGQSVWTARFELSCAAWGTSFDITKQRPLWPLGITPFNGAPDLLVVQRPFAETAVDAACRYHLSVQSRSTRDTRYRKMLDNDWAPLDAFEQRIAAPYRRALSWVQAGNSATFMPRFVEVGENLQAWKLDYELDVLSPPGQLAPLFVDGRSNAFEARLLSVAPTAPMIIRAKLDGFVAHDKEPLLRYVKLGPPADRAAQRFDFTISEHQPSTSDPAPATPEDAVPDLLAARVRVGALDLKFPERHPVATASPGRPGRVEVTFDGLGSSARPATHTSPERWRAGVAMSLHWDVSAFGPGDQDPTPLEERDESSPPETLVVPTRPDGDLFLGRFVLSVSEQTTKDESRTLSLDLSQAQGSGLVVGPDIVVLDHDPFFIARVRFPEPLSFPNGQVARFERAIGDAQAGAWSFASTAQAFQVWLPPQGLGEETLKRYAASQSDPFVPDPTKPLRFRLTPPARLTLRKSTRLSALAEAPWNLRRLLGYPGQESPGAVADELAFELLYGLSAKVSVPWLRISEIDAQLGFVASRLGAAAGASDGTYASAHKEYAEHFNARRALIQRRIAHLSPTVTGSLARSPVLEKGVVFRRREQRFAADPVDPANPHAPYRHFEPTDGSEWGLRGGVDWGFESRNVLRELDGASSSGKIAGLGLTPLGGSAFLKAGFADDRVTIYANTFLGRTFFYSIELLGRVGVLWNRAKYVVIYERSVDGSKQFPDPDSAWRGRAVLRKTQEFVQVLETERPFPDGAGSEKTRSFVRGSRFPTAPIQVRGSWGYDVPEGWVLPLWQPGEKHWSRPATHLKVAALGDSGEETFFAGISNPDRLCFFHATATANGPVADSGPFTKSDTDKWPPVALVDFPHATLPSQSGGETPASDAKQPDAPRLEPGYEAFTFELDTTDRPINVVDGRAPRGVAAKIHNVTLARRSTALANGATPELVGAVNAARVISDVAADVIVKFDAATKIKDVTLAQLDQVLEQQQSAWQSALAAQVAAFKNVGQSTLQLLELAQVDAQQLWANSATARRETLEREGRELVAALANLPPSPQWLASAEHLALGTVQNALRRSLAVKLVHDELRSRAQGALAQAEQAERRLQRLLDDLQAKLEAAQGEVNRYRSVLASELLDTLEAFTALREVVTSGDLMSLLRDALTTSGLLPTAESAPSLVQVRRAIAELRSSTAALLSSTRASAAKLLEMGEVADTKLREIEAQAKTYAEQVVAVAQGAPAQAATKLIEQVFGAQGVEGVEQQVAACVQSAHDELATQAEHLVAILGDIKLPGPHLSAEIRAMTDIVSTASKALTTALDRDALIWARQLAERAFQPGALAFQTELQTVSRELERSLQAA
ncbi:MAG: hypothetical protein K0R38_7656, partial [Polyangiaceae bacterium]|nr:hypothetical protein [Polyangiaceae bacterium]